MEVEILIKLVVATVGIVSAGKIIYEFISGSKSKLREEYKFAKEFINDLNKSNIHPFVIEKGYQAIAGTTTVNSEEIAYILSLENPVKCLKDYVLSKKYLDHLETNGNLKISFSKKYKSKYSRNWRKLFYLGTYFVSAFIALSPLILTRIYEFNLNQFMLLSVFLMPVFSLLAFDSLRSFTKIYRSEKLEENQKSHTQHIIISDVKNIKNA